MIDVAAARDLFEDSTDGTVGIEEEFALLDPQDHRLIPAFERLRDAGQADDVLADAIAGELISSEIEIRSGRGADYEDARRAPARGAPAAVRRSPRARACCSARPERTRCRTTGTSTSSTRPTTTGWRTG